MMHIRLGRFNPRPDARGSFVCVVGQHGTPDEPNRGLRCVGGKYRRMLLVARLGGTRAVPPLPRERIIGRHLDGPPARPSVQETSSRVGPDRGRGWTGRGGVCFWRVSIVPAAGAAGSLALGCAKSEPEVFGVSLASGLQGIAIR